jgi:hypothetical protein
VTGEMLESFNAYAIAATSYSPSAKQLADIMKITELESPKTWSELLSPETNRITKIAAQDAARFAKQHLPKIVKLLTSGPVAMAEGPEDRKTRVFKGKSVLSVILIEADNRFSSPMRLVEILESVTLLYDACTIITESAHETLGVIACDSGSDKSFDFLGVAKVIECVKDVILSLWDRVVFYKEKKVSEHIDLISKSLPIIENISSLESQNKISPEQAELLRRNIFDGVAKFSMSGAIIPEIEPRSYYNPRVLMAPEPKLLTSSIPEPENDLLAKQGEGERTKEIDEKDTESKVDPGNLSSEDIAAMRKILKIVDSNDQRKSQDETDRDDQLQDEDI